MKKCLLVLLLFFCAMRLGLASEPYFSADGIAKTRAVLIANDAFINQKNTNLACTNNAQAVFATFQDYGMSSITRQYNTLSTVDEFKTCIQQSFAQSDDDDINILYISTHGIQNEQNPNDIQLVLSNGQHEGYLSAKDIAAAFSGVLGKHILIVDACYSGGLIGKGMSGGGFATPLTQDGFYVLASSGGSEESWYWVQNQSDTILVGAGYFSAALTQALSQAEAYPADTDRNGNITFTELYNYLYDNHGASVVQCYPQGDETTLFQYQPSSNNAIPYMHHLLFYNDVVTDTSPELSFSFQLEKPVIPVYQIVYYNKNRWDFENAQFNYDPNVLNEDEELKPLDIGTHRRKIVLKRSGVSDPHYALVNVLVKDGKELKFVGSKVIGILPNAQLLVPNIKTDTSFQPLYFQELPILVQHPRPCYLTLKVLDSQGKTIYTIAKAELTRPENLKPNASTFTWNGKTANGELAPPGTYHILCTSQIGEQKISTTSAPFELLQSQLYEE